MDQLEKENRLNGASIIQKNISWAYFNDSEQLSRQGFKIHISAHLENCIDIYKILVPYLLKSKIAFKVVGNMSDLEKLNIGLFGSSQIGKFMTIYPEENFVEVINKCFEKCRMFFGPIISSDIRLEGSIVYYRYGIINPTDGKQEYLLDPQGNYYKDERSNQTAIPSWLTDPLSQERVSASLNDFIITKVIRNRGRGGIYEGFQNQKKIIIKESRPFGEYVNKEDNGRNKLLNEIKILNKLKNNTNTPNIVTLKEIDQHLFCCIQKIEGMSLKEFILGIHSIPEETILEIENILQRIVSDLHNSGIYHCDLNPDNIIIGNSIYLIDFEHSIDFSEYQNVSVNYGTKYFYPEYQDNVEALDQSGLRMRDLFGIQQVVKALREPNWYKEVVGA